MAMDLLAKTEGIHWPVLAGIIGAMLMFYLGVTIWKSLVELIKPGSLFGKFRRFFQGDQGQLQVHDKAFPGYDLASVHRALASYLKECCTSSEALGGTPWGTELRDVLNPEAESHHRKARAQPACNTRLPVGVDEEESFVSNCIYLAVVRGEKGEEKIVVHLNSATAHNEYEEDMEAQSPPLAMLKLAVACRSREVANRFFHEIEERRRRLSVFRGKVIDPVVAPGGIRTITFKEIKQVTERDLVLPEPVKGLIHGSIVSFYRNHEALARIGVEMKRGILFHSPPGTGKTSISLYLAGLLPNFTVCFVSGRRLLYPRELCSMARYLQPAMLVFEDIDLIAQERDMNGLATVLGELMNQIDGCEVDEQVLFIMNTNSMDRIEEAVRNRPGRVDQIIHIPLPDRELRTTLLKRFAANLKVSDEQIGKAAAGTEGATPAMLKEVVKRAAVRAVERNGKAGDAALEITDTDLLMAYEQIQYMRDPRTGASMVL